MVRHNHRAAQKKKKKLTAELSDYRVGQQEIYKSVMESIISWRELQYIDCPNVPRIESARRIDWGVRYRVGSCIWADYNDGVL